MFCAYKPPDERNDQFINYLESIVHSLNLENDIFIVGDLNMNWLDNKGEPLKAFCSQNNLYNHISSPTRTVRTKAQFSSTLIDVILHNNASINNTAVINFPFSDHDLVLCECNFKTSKFIPTMIYSRKINEKSLNQIFCFVF